MSKKYKGKVELVPWMSARPDNVEKRFIQVGDTLLFNKVFRSLTVGCRYTYFCMSMECAGRRNFTFPQKTAKKYKITPPVCGVILTNWKPKGSSKSIPERQHANQIDMNSATSGSFPLAPRPAPLPWLYLVNLTQIEPRAICKNSHWLCRFG